MEADAGQQAYLSQREQIWDAADPTALSLRILVEIDARSMHRA